MQKNIKMKAIEAAERQNASRGGHNGEHHARARSQNRSKFNILTEYLFKKHPTARIVSQLGGKADDRAEAPTGGLCRTASWVHEKP